MGVLNVIVWLQEQNSKASLKLPLPAETVSSPLAWPDVNNRTIGAESQHVRAVLRDSFKAFKNLHNGCKQAEVLAKRKKHSEGSADIIQ